MNKRITNKEEFISKVFVVHGDTYDYSLVSYRKSIEKVSIICRKHGQFLQSPNNHLKGSGCPKCAIDRVASIRIGTTEEFIKKSSHIHSNRYSYNNTIFNGVYKPVNIVCNVHGEFTQIANDHLQGSGCQLCANENQNSWSVKDWEKSAINSNNFDSYKLYIIKCFDDNETFYKVGKTYRTLDKRFCGKRSMPYNYEIIYTIQGDAEFVSMLEKEIKNRNSHFRYIPSKEFKGINECFSSIDYNGS